MRGRALTRFGTPAHGRVGGEASVASTVLAGKDPLVTFVGVEGFVGVRVSPCGRRMSETKEELVGGGGVVCYRERGGL